LHQPRIGILIVAYNAALTLQSVLDRIPASFRERTTRVFICDDHSHDSTYLVGLGYKQLAPQFPIDVIRNARNLGYGGNQKLGYRLAIEHNLDIVVLLHGDGQYAPECLEDMVAPLERGEADAVLGSRMMEKGAARRGGMPMYKYMGNRVLTRFENAMLGTSLTEFHSGYRAYTVRALSRIAFEQNSNDFDFDTEIIIQLHAAGLRITEIPIPTYYGDEICYVNGMKYAKDVCLDVIRYRLGKLGFSSGGLLPADEDLYQFKDDPSSSHTRIIRWLTQMPPSRVLDLGCAGGRVADLANRHGHSVTGVDVIERPGVRARVDDFVQADLNDGIPPSVGGNYDVVLAADVLEHVREPERLLDQIGRVMVSGGVLLVSIPNFGHWYPRFRTAAGRFDYDERGILDRTHLRFFTRRSFLSMVRRNGYEVLRSEVTGTPIPTLIGNRRLASLLGRADRALVAVWPTLFGYQFLYELRPAIRDRAGAEQHALAKSG
jgi:2-polyprenyl-3-methyl-5-hydroxy-6-metoxy-1,4-benzoquinol methylase